MSNGLFHWSPNVDQAFNEDHSLSLRGTALAFSKNAGKRFTMDAPGQVLSLLVSPDLGEGGANYTVWGMGGSSPTIINLQNGTLAYEGRIATETAAGTYFQPSGLGIDPSETDLTVANSASLNIRSDVWIVYGVFIVDLLDEGSIDIQCRLLLISPLGQPNAKVTISDKARMSLRASAEFFIAGSTFLITSLPDTGNALSWISTDPRGMTLKEVSVSSSGRSLLEGTLLQCEVTQIQASETAETLLRFNAVDIDAASKFTLAPGSAKMRFDGYSENKQPFYFISQTYPEGIFNFVTDKNGKNSGEFLIWNPSEAAFGASAVLGKKLVSIDSQIQDPNSKRVRTQYEKGLIRIWMP